MKTSSLIAFAALLPLSASLGLAATAQENWTNLCAKCHAADGSGNTKIGKKLKLKDYTSAEVQAAMTDEEMTKAIKEGVTENGKEKMKAYTDLSDDEVKELVALTRSFKK